ncbi:MAG: hypothetical protein GYB68_11660 [Chloroflexi bacterium]|nr:hypothetical protein [Chloroflexota bacterium]
MLPTIVVGPVSLRMPGLALIVGVWIALEIASRLAQHQDFSEDQLFSAGFCLHVARLAGARLGFVLLNLDLYTSITPLSRAVLAAFALSSGTENIWFGLVAGGAFFWWFAQQNELAPLRLADALVPAVLMMGIAVGFANFFSGDYYGVFTTLPWGIDLWGGVRHPTQIYFLLACVILLGGLIWLLLTDRAQGWPPGTISQLCLLGLGVAWLLIEPLRADSPVFGDGWRIWQMIGLTAIVVSLLGFAWRAPSQAQNVQPAEQP